MPRWLIGLALVTLASSGTATAGASQDGLIAFSRAHVGGDMGGSAIWTMQPDGSGLRELTEGALGASAEYATFSPGGDKLAYWQGEESAARLVVMEPDGTSARAVTKFPATAVSDGIAWDPLAPRIILTSYDTDCEDCRSTLYAVKLDGSGRQRLRVPGGHASHATFMPNGRELLYDTTLSSCSGIYGLNRAATKRRTLIGPIKRHGRCLVASSQPSPAPTGRLVAFVRRRRASNKSAIFTYNLRTHATHQVSPWGDIGYDGPPTWSADGRSVAYDAFSGSGRYIFRVSVKSVSKPERLTTGWSPSWKR